MLTIYNTQTRQKTPFKPIQEGEINLYVCGMTVYDYCHLGHARVMVSFDMVTRYMRTMGYKVNYVCNITDIDDKIINRANENKEDFHQLTERFIAAMHEDAEKLRVLRPNKEPRATAHIADIITMIETLVKKGFAYVAKNGDVYYEIKQFKEYGKLSHKDIEGLRAGARVDIGEDKKDPLDFVLWKSAKPDEPSWDSPWGKGRPGWHIECSAMSTKCLGDSFDIHGGGFDLTFPHHENEIAQSEGATGKPFVNTWMHVGFVQVNKEKMSKSLGNFFTIREVLKEYTPEVIRYFLLSSHYRSQINYSTDNLTIAKNSLGRLYTSLRGFEKLTMLDAENDYSARFHAAMQDDFNTPEAFAVLFDLAHEINRLRDSDTKQAGILANQLKYLAGTLGLLEETPEEYFHTDIPADVQELISAREEARANKDWAESDRLRDELLEKGWKLEDTASGTTVSRK